MVPDEASPPAPSATPGGEPPRGSRAAVLVVDDEEPVRWTLRRLFARRLPDVDVLTAASGAEALAIMERQRVEVILTDYRMPGMNGLELIAEVGRLHPDVPRLLITAYPDLNLAVEAANRGHVLRFVIKPWDPDELVAALRGALDARRAERERHTEYARAFEALRKRAA